MKKIPTTNKVLAAAAIVISAAGVSAVPSPAAPAVGSSTNVADAPSAMDACLKGEAPDDTQTTFLSGTNGRASYPRGVQPDNAVFPGDVVTVEITGRLRYNATEWTGPAGTGTPDHNNIRPYAATASWDNLPDGRVGSPVAAVGLRKCTAAPAKQAVRLLYGIKDKVLSDNGGGFIITTRVWRAPGRITIDRTEVTQGVQNRSGHVALIARKRTFVRVFFRHEFDGSTAMEGVTGTLHVPGVAGAVSPLVNSHVTSRTGGGDDRRLDNSLLFEVPRAALGQGARQFVVTVTPPAGRSTWSAVRHVPVEFGPTTSLKVIGLRYSYYNVPQALTDQHWSAQPGLRVRDGWWQARTLADWKPMRQMAENVLPLARLTISDDAAGDTDSAWGSASFDCEAGRRADGLRYCGGYEDAIAWAKKYADEICPKGGCLVVLFQPEIQLTGATGTCFCTRFGHQTPSGNDVINVQGARSDGDPGRTLAHEIGHYYGLLHTWDDPHFGHQNRDATIGDVVGLRYAPEIRLEPERRLDGGRTYDLMTYHQTQWLSVYSYCKAMHAIPGPHPVCYPGWDR